MTPTSKTTAAGVSGAIAVIIVWFAREVCDVEIPAEVGAAIAAVIAFAGAYLKEERRPVLPEHPHPRRARE